jgi:oxygen-independent coproporphyrinogen-3 oxidase
VHKCHYCDFYSFVDTRDRQAAFVNRLIRELEVLAPHAAGAPLRTIFVGGGTPSLLRVKLWERLLRVISGLFDLSEIRRAGAGDEAEFTVECNPESATPELMGVLRAGGVNRVSIGAQSFNPRHLKMLERWHDPENVARAALAARAAGIQRQSIDLIFAIPGQTVDEWSDDLARAVALGTTHLSCYNLTYEQNTAMTRRLGMGEFEPVGEDDEAEMFELTVRMLRGAGLARYEVSNFARPGHESRHNIAYWLQEQWLAAGPSASGHAWAGSSMLSGSHRWKNLPRLGDYLDSTAAYAPIVDHEAPDPLRLVRERLMMGLRLERGMDGEGLLADLERLSPGGAAGLRRAVERVVDRGHMVVEQGGRWRLTDEGFLFTDSVAADLMHAVR